MLKPNTFNKIDCQKGMSKLKSNSIDMILTSPPYDDMRTYDGQQNEPSFSELGAEISRVLKVGGMCAVIINDRTKYVKSLTTFKLAVDWHENTDLRLWEDIIYSRDGNPGAYWNKRFRRDHEYVMVFLKVDPKDKTPRPQYFNKTHLLVDTKCNGVVWGGKRKKSDGSVEERKNITVRPKKCCGTIFRYNASNKENNKLKNEHPAPFPDKLAEDLIKAFTKPKMTVLDIFMGSGTTGIMAYKNKRKFIGFDLSEVYVKLAKKRFKEEAGEKWD